MFTLQICHVVCVVLRVKGQLNTKIRGSLRMFSKLAIPVNMPWRPIGL
jgi:hypothetical protein